MPDDGATDNETHWAKAVGRVVGSRPLGQAKECPHPFRNPILRRAWLAGFAEGRSQLHDVAGDDASLDDAPSRITYSLALRCPRCDRVGTALASEAAASFQDNIVFRVEALSPGFRDIRKGSSLGDTFIVCAACDVAAR